MYAKWSPKNPLKVTLPANANGTFASMQTGLVRGSDVYVLGDFGSETDKGETKWYTYQFFDKADDNLSGNLRSNQYRTGSNYYGLYPASAAASLADAKNTSTTIVLNYTGQKYVSATDNTLVAYDFMTGKISGTGLDSKLDFAKLGEKLTFNLTNVPSDKNFKKMVLYVPGVYIPTLGVVDMTADSPAFKCTETKPTDNYNHFEMELDLSAGDDGNLAISTMLPPFNANGKSVILTLIDSENNYYNAYFDGQTYVAGTDYEASAEVVELPHFVTIGGKNVATHNLGAYSPEDYGTLHGFTETVDFEPQFGSDASCPTFEDWNAIATASSETITAVAEDSHGVHGIKFTAGEGDSAVSLFVPANGFVYEDGSGLVRNSEVNLWTNTKVGDTEYVYSLYGSSDEDENGVMMYGSTNLKYGFRPFKK